jgi:tetratricopeptide (TPR) repeat protein
MEMLAFWLRQTIGGHPLILEDLVAGGKVPESMEMRMNDGRTVKTVTFDLVGVREVPGGELPEQMAGWNRVTAGAAKDALLVLLDWVVSRGEFAASITADRSGTMEKAEKAFADRDPIRGILETVRVEMVVGTSPTGVLDRHIDLIRESRTAANLLSSLGAAGPEEFDQAVQTLAVLKDAFEDEAAVLNVLTAQNLARMGQMALAERAFREAIMADPSLAVAYQQLGDIFRATGRHSLGWLAYEAFEILSPEHPANEQIEALRSLLLTNFPDFF